MAKDKTAREAMDLLKKAGLTRNQVKSLDLMNYFDNPASKGHHLRFLGGLARHSINVTKRLVGLSKTLGVKWPRKESPYLVGMLHDLVKCKCYRLKDFDTNGPIWEYVQPIYPGHGACSVALAAELGIQLKTEEMAAITYHMGVYGVGKEYTDKEFDSALNSQGSFILATVSADWYAARVDEEAK